MPGPPDLLEEFDPQLGVEGVLAGLQELVIVNPPPTPVLGLLAENVAPLVEWPVLRPPEDAVGVLRLRGVIAVDQAEVAFDG